MKRTHIEGYHVMIAGRDEEGREIYVWWGSHPLGASPEAAEGGAAAVAEPVAVPFVGGHVKADSNKAREAAAALARTQGYEGDACGECGAMRLRRNGSCLVCDSCGRTTGCS